MMDNFITMLNLQSRLHTQQGAIALGELFKSASDEILSLREENEALKMQVEVLRKKANDTLECATNAVLGGVQGADVESWVKKIKADGVREFIEQTCGTGRIADWLLTELKNKLGE